MVRAAGGGGEVHMAWRIKVSIQGAKWYLTSFTRCPGVLEIDHVHSFLLGYLSGQLGLVMVPLVDVTLCSQPAVGYE